MPNEIVKHRKKLLNDIRALKIRMDMLPHLGTGYTFDQRIEHHKMMVRLLEELRNIGGLASDIK